MSIPALVRLRAAVPQARIALLVPEKLAELWPGQPFLDEIIPFGKTDGVGTVSKRLHEGRFDTALIFPNSFRSALEPWLAGIPTRIGHTGGGRAPLLTRKVPRPITEIPMHKKSATEVQRLVQNTPKRPRETFPSTAHHIHQYLHLVSELGADQQPLAPKIELTHAEKEAFRARFNVLRHSGPVIGINPGAEYGPAKRWPIDRLISVAARIEPQVHPLWLIFGAAADVPSATQFEKSLREQHSSAVILNLAGRTSLRELCGGLSVCDVLLTNDTGPMHLAAAVGTRVVVLFGSTSPEMTGPGLPGTGVHDLILGQAPCAPCFRRICPIDFRCMTSISIDRVASSILSGLRSQKR
jgi:lipopolysaccharide heptosyltransferase II